MSPHVRDAEVAYLRRRLQAERRGFDSAYEHTDDYSVWVRQHNKARAIAQIKRRLRELGDEVDA
jgi:hypothetical protein